MRETYRRIENGVMWAVCVGCGVVSVALLVWLLGFIALRGFAALTPATLFSLPTGDPTSPGGLGHAIVGTLELLALASIIALPTGVLAGVHLSEMRHTDRVLVRVVRFVADVLAGVPSIVVGVIGYELVVVPLGRFSGIAGAVGLAFLMIPIVARSTEEVLRLVPDSLREGALALGVTPTVTTLRVVLPAAAGGVVTGVLLAIARAAGETAPLLFTALGSRLLTLDPREPFPALTLQIYAYATGPYEAQRAVAWAGMLVLVGISVVIQLAARAALRR